MSFVHHVFFYLKNPNEAADQAKFMEGIEKLKQIKSIQLINVGVPAATDRPVIVRDYTYSLLVIFENAADEQAYQVDPLHDDFRDNYAHLWNKVVIYDSVEI